MPFLVDRVLEIDFQNHRYEVATSATLNLQGEKQALLFDISGRPYVQVQLGTISIWAMIDTGATPGLTLEKTLYDYLIEKGCLDSNRNCKDVEVWDVHGSHQSRAGVLRRMKIGSFQIDNLSVIESSKNKIGLGALSNFFVSLNFRELDLTLVKPFNEETREKSKVSRLNDD